MFRKKKKKTPSDDLFLHFFFESSESDHVFNYLHDSNSIFRARGINAEIFSGGTVIPTTGLHWSLRTTSTRYAYGWEASGPGNLKPCAASLAPWIRALPMPPAAPWARLVVVTMRSPPSFRLPLNLVATPLRPRFWASSLGTDLGPADVLTSALGSSYSALDLSTCSPHARTASCPRLHPIQARGKLDQ